MCQAVAAIRRTLGISDYCPSRPVLVRKPTRFGARGTPMNGAVLIGGFAESGVIADLVREHRMIRRMADDVDSYRRRGRDA
jgi:hypothetical protein